MILIKVVGQFEIYYVIKLYDVTNLCSTTSPIKNGQPFRDLGCLQQRKKLQQAQRLSKGYL